MSAVEVHPPIVETQTWSSEEDTASLARRLAARAAIRNAFITLQGDLGAGKTTLVRHLLRAMGVAGRVKSPTYAVVEPHTAQGVAISHFDFYRFSDPRELEDAGLRDLLAAPGLKLAEWPEHARAALPQEDLRIHIEQLDNDQRRVTLRAFTHTGRDLLA